MTKNGTLVEVKKPQEVLQHRKRGLLHAVDDVSFSITKGKRLDSSGNRGAARARSVV
jgi:ABC-type uncharacterized transport system ATPase subunit